MTTAATNTVNTVAASSRKIWKDGNGESKRC
jgi:hypothetical protein